MDFNFSYACGGWISSMRTRGKNEHVELVLLFHRLHTFRCDLNDGIRINVDEVNVVLIEYLVERLLLTWPPAAKWVRWNDGC